MASAYPTTRDRLRAILTEDANGRTPCFDIDIDQAVWEYHDMRVGRVLEAAAKRGFDDFESIEDELDFVELEEELGTLEPS